MKGSQILSSRCGSFLYSALVAQRTVMLTESEVILQSFVISRTVWVVQGNLPLQNHTWASLNYIIHMKITANTSQLVLFLKLQYAWHSWLNKAIVPSPPASSFSQTCVSSFSSVIQPLSSLHLETSSSFDFLCRLHRFVCFGALLSRCLSPGCPPSVPLFKPPRLSTFIGF